MDNSNNRAFTFQRYGKSPQSGFQPVTLPEPNAHQLLVEVYAAGLNPIDNLIPTGIFKPVLPLTLPAVIGSDLAGIVVATGSEVTRFKPGDEVFASTFDSDYGSLAEFTLVNESAAALKPVNLDFIQAASLPMVSLTAWQALFERAGLQPGQKVFIPAGAGGIGSFAIQLANQSGVTVATTTSSANVEWVTRLGADVVVDYTKERFESILQDYDAVLATLKGDEIEKYPDILRAGGKIVSLVGPLDVSFARARRLNVMITAIAGWLSRRIKRLAKKRGVDYSFLFVRPDGQQLSQISHYIETGRIRPVIDSVFPFEKAAAALEHLQQGHAKGKVVVAVKKESRT
jgi:NADPH:quinone reductase-like Zn-dependent oxidoreductase